jgi:hypothetical protein
MRWIFAMLASRNGIDAGRLAAVGPVGQPIICRSPEQFRKRRFRRFASNLAVCRT